MTNSVGCKLELSVPGGVCVGSIPNYEIDSTFCINYPIQLTSISGLLPPPGNGMGSPAYATFSPSETDTNPTVSFAKDTCYDLFIVTTKNLPGRTCYDTTFKPVCVSGPQADYTTEDTLQFCAPVVVQFKNTSKGGEKYIWSFGDGSILETNNPEPYHTYEKNKLNGWQVQLLAIDSNECRDSVVKNSLINGLGLSQNSP